MDGINRREFGMFAAALGALMSGSVEARADEPVLATQKVYRYDELPVKKNDIGGESRALMSGKLPTGELVEAHETVVAPGQMPHAPHLHEHSELILIREGSVEFENNGKAERVAGPGDVLFCVSNVLHGLKNVGTVPARYFVVAIGPQTPSVYPGAK